MIGLDTNVLLRYIMQDDATQPAPATRLIEGLSEDTPGFITLVSVIELTWILESGHKLGSGLNTVPVDIFHKLKSH